VWGTGTPKDRDDFNRREVARAGANTTVLSDTLYSKGLKECATTRAKVWLRKKPSVDLCGFEYSTVRYTIVNRSCRMCCHKGKGLVVKKTHGLYSKGLAESDATRAKV
jgi:hypothetical protein